MAEHTEFFYQFLFCVTQQIDVVKLDWISTLEILGTTSTAISGHS